MLIKNYRLYDRSSWEAHDLSIFFSWNPECGKVYTVFYDLKLVSAHPNFTQAQEAAVDVVIDQDLSSVNRNN